MARLLVIVAAALVLAAPAAAAGPRLALTAAHPTTIRGTGFAARERVLLRLGQIRLRLTTSSTGRFTAVLRAHDRCSGGRVLAVGTSGDRAVLRLPPFGCPPATAP